MSRRQGLEALPPSRFLPTRPGQNVTSSQTRSGTDYNLTSRLMSLSVRNAFARVGLVVKPELRQVIRRDITRPATIVLFQQTEFDTDQFEWVDAPRAILFPDAQIVEQQESNIGMQPNQRVNLSQQVTPYFFIIRDQTINMESHAFGAVQVPAAKAVYFLNSQEQEELDFVANRFQTYFQTMMDPEIQVYAFPNDLMDPERFQKQIPERFADFETIANVVQNINMQEVPGVECEGFCSQFSFILPYLMSRDKVFSSIKPDLQAVRKDIQRNMQNFQATYRNRFTLSFFNDVKREMGLL